MTNTRYSSRRPLTDDEEAQIRKMIASDPDNPELTDPQLAQGRPFAQMFPEFAEKISRGGRGEAAKSEVTLRLDADVLEKLRGSGPGWQQRVNAMLRKVMGL
ncbi:MAG TPA: BrnA antitoxin family protein [Pelagibacterium sp.]|uniref:BrnA antitoxin family protein n=1 Tax=Pelagibacterium sp. TaxID=1967288 RepID=UPI002C18A008|nr:BrnA antitoxin family protein [Pelagibacterium sp.]HWJ86886.1 BrnA antitoxin family protein [Pelagibacterium sp.]